MLRYSTYPRTMKTNAVLVVLSFVALIAFASANPLQQAQQPLDICDACVNLLLEAEKIEDYSNVGFKHKMRKVCKKFGRLQKICTSALTLLSTTLNEAIKYQILPQEACELVRLCKK